MEKMIGYCGYNCYMCAARSDDPDVRQKMVDGWYKFFGHQNYTAENVKCDGCRSDGKVADQVCKARPCAKEKGVKNCAYCDAFPCDKGMYGNEEWRGLGIASVQCVAEHGLEGYVAILASRYGDVVEFEPFKGKSPQEAREMLCGAAPGA